MALGDVKSTITKVVAVNVAKQAILLALSGTGVGSIVAIAFLVLEQLGVDFISSGPPKTSLPREFLAQRIGAKTLAKLECAAMAAYGKDYPYVLWAIVEEFRKTDAKFMNRLAIVFEKEKQIRDMLLPVGASLKLSAGQRDSLRMFINSWNRQSDTGSSAPPWFPPVAIDGLRNRVIDLRSDQHIIATELVSLACGGKDYNLVRINMAAQYLGLIELPKGLGATIRNVDNRQTWIDRFSSLSKASDTAMEQAILEIIKTLAGKGKQENPQAVETKMPEPADVSARAIPAMSVEPTKDPMLAIGIAALALLL